MEKKYFAKLGVEIASKDMGISDIDIEFKDADFFYNKDINAMFIQQNFTIIFNINWVNNTQELEIMKRAFHEARHAYQKICIEFPELVNNANKDKIEQWKKEFQDYSNPNSVNYLEQDIEKDAVAYSERLISQVVDILKEEERKEKIKLYNQLYSKASKINNDLLSKSNLECGYQDVTFKEIMLFYMSSHALSFIKYLALSEQLAYSAILNARCLIEGAAIIIMHEKGDIDAEQEELFKKQYNLLEYKIYKNYKQFDGKVLHFEKLEKDYDDSYSSFKIALGNDEARTKKIVNSRIPFLCDESISFESLIRKYLSERHLDAYKIYSMLIHPHDYGNLYDSDLSNFNVVVLEIIKDMFTDSTVDESETLSSDLAFVHDKGNKDISNILDSTVKQAKKINDLVSAFEKEFERNFVSNSLRQIADIFIDITYDLLMGMSEQLKMKWKILIEMMATIDVVYFSDIYNVNYNYDMLRYHTRFKFLENINEDASEPLKAAFDIYTKQTKDSIPIDEFRNKYRKMLGFMVKSNEQISTLKNLVFNYIDKRIGNQQANDNILLADILKVSYEESQILSHANGYLYFSNSAAWTEDINIYASFENLFINFLQKLKKVFELHKIVEETNKNDVLIDTIGSSITYIKSNAKKKLKSLMKSRVNKQLYKEAFNLYHDKK